jgi:hypothetical protein
VAVLHRAHTSGFCSALEQLLHSVALLLSLSASASSVLAQKYLPTAAVPERAMVSCRGPAWLAPLLLALALLPALSSRTATPAFHRGVPGRGARGGWGRPDVATGEDAEAQDALVMRVPSDYPSVERALAAGSDLEIVVEQGWHRWDGQLVVTRQGVHLSSQPHSSLTGRWVMARRSSGLLRRTSLLHSCVAAAPEPSVLVLGGSGKGVRPWKFEHCRVYSHGLGSIALVCSGASKLILASCILGGHNQEEQATTGLICQDESWLQATNTRIAHCSSAGLRASATSTFRGIICSFGFNTLHIAIGGNATVHLKDSRLTPATLAAILPMPPSPSPSSPTSPAAPPTQQCAPSKKYGSCPRLVMDACSVEGKVMAAALPRGMALGCSMLGDTVFVDDPAGLRIFSSVSSADVPPQGGGGGGGGDAERGKEGGGKDGGDVEMGGVGEGMEGGGVDTRERAFGKVKGEGERGGEASAAGVRGGSEGGRGGEGKRGGARETGAPFAPARVGAGEEGSEGGEGGAKGGNLGEARERNAVTSGDHRVREEGGRGREREREREKLWAQAFAVCKGGTEVYAYGGIY